MYQKLRCSSPTIIIYTRNIVARNNDKWNSLMIFLNICNQVTQTINVIQHYRICMVNHLNRYALEDGLLKIANHIA